METTASNEKPESLTHEHMLEALELIKALAPRNAPDGVNIINTLTGLRIMKNAIMPHNTVMVSADLFDMIYSANNQDKGERNE